MGYLVPANNAASSEPSALARKLQKGAHSGASGDGLAGVVLGQLRLSVLSQTNLDAGGRFDKSTCFEEAVWVAQRMALGLHSPLIGKS
jgi:hypothetical protein